FSTFASSLNSFYESVTTSQTRLTKVARLLKEEETWRKWFVAEKDRRTYPAVGLQSKSLRTETAAALSPQ
ncbi:hypothetical protein Trydic_g10126, partial [Trypoxylus dichotomus]